MNSAGKPRSPARTALVALLLSAPFLFVLAAALLAAELRLRQTTNLPYLSRSHCFRQTKVEAPAFHPACEETMRTPAGEVPFRTNELGLRDRPLAELRGGGIAALGDSFVEGFWLEESKSLTRAIERRAGFPSRLLNLGIRASGPTQQAIRLFLTWKQLPLQGVVWFLNPSDPLDEILFHARNPSFTLARGSWSELTPSWSFTPAYLAFTRLSLALGDRSYLLLYVADRLIKQASQTRMVEGAPFSPELHCRSISLVAAELRKERLPLLFVAIPHGQASARRPYLGVQVDDAKFEQLLDCARATGAPVVDLRPELDGKPEWYWKNDWHFNEQGVEAAAALAAPRIRAAWKGLR